MDVIEDTGAKTLHYPYNFGDGWEHTVKLLGIDDGEPGAAYPVLLNARGDTEELDRIERLH
ncbi:IS1096 element passenger TnpR family protein [Pelagibius litoralis]|uniref:IS1096 element passenger TnpR family protein n=1 Tax=Pelagibius litoralis TaxID=374515 RepID=UPI00197D79B2|nr:hypothetical protein [Pelagibius litoralis]